MSVWTTKALDRAKNYIVIQHTLRGVNYVINGVKFRDSYAVVEKDSKTFYSLKKIPVLRHARTFPLTHLAKVSFITRTADIRTVYGQDVYVSFLNQKEAEDQATADATELHKLEQKILENEQREQDLRTKIELEQQIKLAEESGNLEKVQELEQQIPEITKCAFVRANGNLCGYKAYEHSPSHYCGEHLLEDPKLVEFGLEKPKFMTKDETKAFREKVKNTLKKASK